MVFVRDTDTGTMIPARGFSKTIARGVDWRALVNDAMERGRCTGQFPVTGGSGLLPATARRISADAALVLIGGSPDESRIETVLGVLPLLGALVSGEQVVRNATAQIGMGADATAKADVLSRWLAASRDRLRDALRSSDEARATLVLQEEELNTSAEELSSANDHLVEMNAALELSISDAERQRKRAEQANRAKSDFLATMSHELRTPLNAIGGFSSLLEMGIGGDVTPQQLEYLARIKRSQEYLSTLISDILNFAKVEAGAIQFDLTDVYLNAELSSLGSLIEIQAANNGVEYQFFPSASEIRVRADRDKLAQIILNLLTNAAKFTPRGGRVELRSAAVGTVAQIQVADTGKGIPENRLASIFEPFVQLERRLESEQSGVGLGLAISRDLAERMGGGITVTSAPGAGATFTVELPLSPSAG